MRAGCCCRGRNILLLLLPSLTTTEYRGFKSLLLAANALQIAIIPWSQPEPYEWYIYDTVTSTTTGSTVIFSPTKMASGDYLYIAYYKSIISGYIFMETFLQKL